MAYLSVCCQLGGFTSKSMRFIDAYVVLPAVVATVVIAAVVAVVRWVVQDSERRLC